MSTYIIAEIGQNHNGSMELARKLIDVAAMPVYDFFTGETLPGVNAVKFTKRDLDEELTRECAARPYLSPHSYGATYIEHRRALELCVEQHAELEKYAHAKGLDFVETLCSPGCLKLLDHVKVDAIKVASRDVTNIPLLEGIGALSHRVIISTGMCTLAELRNAIDILSKTDKKISILHCISQYPAMYDNINLRSIPYLQKQFPGHRIGYSDHSIGIVLPAVAVAMGATIIEKHLTLSRMMKGSDHAGSLEPEGLYRTVRDIRNVESSLGEEKKELCADVTAAREKLSRSLAVAISLEAGEVLREEHLCMRSPGSGMSWDERHRIIGKTAKINIPANSLAAEGQFS